MSIEHGLSRRRFFGGAASALGVLGLTPGALLAQPLPDRVPSLPQGQPDEYDAMAKLGNNENPYGPPDSVVAAMTKAFKYANRYGYPDGNLAGELAALHGVGVENILLGAGSGEILDVSCSALLQGGKSVLGSDPSYAILYSHAAGIKSDTIKVPLLPDFSQNIPALIRAARTRNRDVGFVYLVNPNNPTGRIVTAGEVRQLLDGIPEDMPVLIDEAYHHFVEDSAYATSVPYVIEGRPVIVARTFSKIAALAGMRVGYAIAPRDLIQRIRPHMTGSVNACARWGAVAALKDTASQQWVKQTTVELRQKATADLQSLGYDCIPSQTNFFMVHLRRPVQPVIEAFRKKGVIVGRPFPPMLEHLRVSIGTPDEMRRFAVAFREIVATGASRTG